MSEQSDKHFLRYARDAAKRSTCRKKDLGCVLITVRGEFFSGWNGPPEIFGKCEVCHKTGDGIRYGYQCRAVHAERRALLRAAKAGASTKGATLYSYMGIPCKDCCLELIEAGVKRIVCINSVYYDKLSKRFIEHGILAKKIVVDIVEMPDSNYKFHRGVKV